MLKELYDYAINHQLTLPPGYVNKTIKAYICLSTVSANYAAVEMGSEEAIPCPDIGSLANGTDKCNILVEKYSIVIPDEPTKKSRFFLDTLKSCSRTNPFLNPCVAALESSAMTKRIRQELDRHKVRASDRISFQIDGKPILEHDGILDWWLDFRRQFQKTDTVPSSICMITGEPTSPVMTTPPVNGLHAVGGHASGDALICFDKSAFCSYGLKKAENAPVSETAIAAVKAALDHLLADAPVLAGMKFVHWYSRDIDKKEDPICQFLDLGLSPDESGEDETEISGESSDEEEEIAEVLMQKRQRERAARQQADQLVTSVEQGTSVPAIDAVYYILMLTGVSGRVMVRRFEQGSYKNLQYHIRLWYSDLELINSSGTSMIPNCKLTARLIRLLPCQKNGKLFERLNRELPGLTPAVITAVLSGTDLPDSVAVRALAYIRSQMLASEDNGDSNTNRSRSLDGLACQWLKIWLIRKNRTQNREEFLMNVYNINHPSAAYHCGGLMAVYAKIQQIAMPEVNAGIIQRYYASASRTPALVLSQLNRLSNFHLDKLKNPWHYEKKLAELYTALGNEIPVTLSLEEQSYFALGYYQKWAELNISVKKEKTDISPEDNDNMKEDTDYGN